MRVPAAIFLCLTLAACSIFTRSIERPTASVRDVSMTTAGFGGVRGALRLDVMNPNGFGVPLSGIDWQLSVGGARAVRGTVELSQTIPARGTAPVTTTLAIDPQDAVAVARALAMGASSYQLSARLHFSTPIGPLDVDLIHAGNLDDAGGLFGALD
ncbi:MAG TPA: LEA type 2 family protein [Kofleriaceae bacterium]|nr:LEA type 2 family protein [Kofleriaceae bacterium]